MATSCCGWVSSRWSCARSLIGLHDLLVNQAIVPSLTNRIRWQNHRYVIRQSLGFFQNDFAGRIANRIMQTGGALRESAVQIVDAIWYVTIYTGSAIVLFAQADCLAGGAAGRVGVRVCRHCWRFSSRASSSARGWPRRRARN